ncbi:MAG: PAS domain S-box protein [Syntrophobacteraceae bacterium]
MIAPVKPDALHGNVWMRRCRLSSSNGWSVSLLWMVTAVVLLLSNGVVPTAVARPMSESATRNALLTESTRTEGIPSERSHADESGIGVSGWDRPAPNGGSAQESIVRVGVLANRGKDICMTEWNATASYLTAQLSPRRFEIVPLDFTEVETAVRNRSVEFILVNSSMYVSLEYDGLVYRIATFQQPSIRKRGEPLPVFGGVVLSRADRDDIRTLRDFAGKRFGAVEPLSFGGWQAAWREFKRIGIRPERDFSKLEFYNTHDAVVEAVRDGLVDGGTVRSTQLERMATEGSIELRDFRVLPGLVPVNSDYPFLLSTPLYPEWPFAVVKGTDLDLGKSVASALLRMSANDPAALASRGAGWAIPQDYASLHECLRELNLHPYENHGKVTLRQAISQYRVVILGTIAIMGLLIIFALWALRTSSRLKESVRALEVSESKYRNVVENIQDVFCRVDASGRISLMSPSAAHVLGYDSVDELIGRGVELLWADPRGHVALLEELARSGHVRDYELKALRRDGTRLTVAATVRLLRDKAGAAIGYEGIWRDITERKRAEESLHRQNQYLAALHETSIGLISRLELDQLLDAIISRASALVGTSHAFIYVYDPERKDLEIRAATGFYRDSIGYRIAPGVGMGGIVWQTGKTVVVDDYSAWAGRSQDKRWEGYRSVIGVPLLSGSEVWGVIGAAYLTEGELFGEDEADILQRFSALASIAYDNARLYENLQNELRERNMAEQELQEAHNRLNAIIDFLPDPTFVIDTDGVVIAWNRAMEEMTGVAKAEMIGKGNYEYAIPFYGERRPILIDFVRSTHAHLLEEKYDLIQRKGTVLYGEVHTPKAFLGKGAYLWGTASVLMNSKREEVGAIESIRDITERKRGEEERRRLEKRLQEVQKAESLGRMAGAVAHHFNNMLGAVMGNLEIAIDDLPGDSGPRTNLLEAMKASRRAVEISGLMLAYIGQTSSRRESLDLAAACGETLRNNGASLARNVRLESDIPSDGPIVHADPVQVKQVLVNLVSNAAEAMGEQDGRISVGIRVVQARDIQSIKIFPSDWEPEAGPYACLEVSDTGCGIDASTLERIFDPFFSTKFTGRGLGLSVALGIVRSLDGAIGVASRSGEGATFRVYLPLSEHRGHAEQERGEPASELVSKTGLVLVVDNEPIIRDLTGEMFKRLGCGIVVAADGAEALELFRERKDEFVLAIVDVVMPGMDGWEVMSSLRTMRADLPVVLASGFDRGQILQGHDGERPDGFLQKPFQFSDLKEVLELAMR